MVHSALFGSLAGFVDFAAEERVVLISEKVRKRICLETYSRLALNKGYGCCCCSQEAVKSAMRNNFSPLFAVMGAPTLLKI
jgi:hypothetical protein